MQWSDKERENFKDSFQAAIGDFVKTIDKQITNEKEKGNTTLKITGLSRSWWEKKFDSLLESLHYKSSVSFGFGYMSEYPSIAFCRKDILGDEFVNGAKLSQQKGVYIWLGYVWKEKEIHLVLSGSISGEDSEKKNPRSSGSKMIFDNRETNQFDIPISNLNEVADKFLELVNVFNSFKPDDFRIENSVQNLGAKDSSNGAESARVNIPLNQILFGPPGTGKTYHTINNALEILGFATKDFESKKVVLDDEKIKQEVTKLGLKIELKENQDENRAMAKALFDDFKQKGQIAFVTFHQSYGYEEFVEGIKPDVESNEVRYQIKSGIFKTLSKSALENPQIPYILIIDEINRGNIAKILGELITLLESSKRIGEPEELRVSLPYSGDEFGVPKNLYIIGTMNTADRSIALLDTALRRRFEFIEMMPDSKHLSEDCDGINLKELLDSMNKRITFLLDREHQIGHSFLLDVKNINDLRAVFAKKIIPLLQEYFYDDYAKINAVLNDNGMIKARTQKDLGINLKDDFVDSEKVVYEIAKSNTWEPDTFIKIYPSK